jgi:RNA polymerase sigma-70 factor (ECF subfamily)
LTETRHPARAESAATAGIAGLTRHLAAKDEAAFREFHARYFDRLYQFLLVVARGQEHAAQEAVQETMLRVARRARVCADEEEFWCWLKAVARNAARDGGRRESRYRVLLEKFFSHAQTDETLPRDGEKTKLNSLLAETLAELAPDERRLVEGKYLDGAAVKELSADTGLTEKAVESRLLRLRRDLRGRLLKKLNER